MAPDPSNSSSSSFILVGVPHLEAFSACLGVLFCSAYIIALLGNGVVLLVIGLDKSLREPIHCFLAMLAVVDVLMVTSIVPKMLSVLWLNSAEIGGTACFVQMFLVHSTTSEESGVLLAMAVDRYVAICHPLRYRAILSHQTIAHIALAIVLRGFLVMIPLTWMVTNLPYCHSHVIPHSYCEQMAVAKLACADPRPSGLYSVAGSSLIVGMDVAFIAASYGMILNTVRGKRSCQKALSTCGCHICVMLLYYIPGILSIYMQQFGSTMSVPAQVLLADLYLTLPTMLNPIIYSMRTKQIRGALLKMLFSRKSLLDYQGQQRETVTNADAVAAEVLLLWHLLHKRLILIEPRAASARSWVSHLVWDECCPKITESMGMKAIWRTSSRHGLAPGLQQPPVFVEVNPTQNVMLSSHFYISLKIKLSETPSASKRGESVGKRQLLGNIFKSSSLKFCSFSSTETADPRLQNPVPFPKVGELKNRGNLGKDPAKSLRRCPEQAQLMAELHYKLAGKDRCSQGREGSTRSHSRSIMGNSPCQTNLISFADETASLVNHHRAIQQQRVSITLLRVTQSGRGEGRGKFAVLWVFTKNNPLAMGKLHIEHTDMLMAKARGKSEGLEGEAKGKVTAWDASGEQRRISPTQTMSTPNKSNTSHLPFLLIGIPDLEALHMWISIPFGLTYIMSLLGNGMVLLTVVLDKTLHEPMYYFISMLAVIDLIFSTAVVPKMLAVFWLDSREIGFEACFIQMFFIHTFTAVESGVLLAMSFDRYIAICNPLRYNTILTTSRTIQMGLLSLARGTGVMTPLMSLLTSLPYCRTRVIPHSYCEHMAVVALACADPAVSDLYSIIVATLLVGTDSVFIAFSYTMILRSVMRLPSQEARLKALGTCGSHVSIILLFYIGGLLSMYLQMFSFGSAPHVQVLVADLYLTVPPMLNPLIYGLKMKQIQEGMLKLLGQLVRPSVPQADKDRSGAERRRHHQKRIDPIMEQANARNELTQVPALQEPSGKEKPKPGTLF
ncbi:uncharacterized protein ACIB01_003975 [Guaruba guarouba]